MTKFEFLRKPLLSVLPSLSTRVGNTAIKVGQFLTEVYAQYSAFPGLPVIKPLRFKVIKPLSALCIIMGYVSSAY